MKAPFSDYLKSIKKPLQQLENNLREFYEYVSILATDSKGFSLRLSQHAKAVSSETMTTERGIVIRVMKDGLYSEYASNDMNLEDISSLTEEIKNQLDQQLQVLKETNTTIYETGKLEDEPCGLFVEMECEELPETTDLSKLVELFTTISNDTVQKDKDIVDCIVYGQSTHVCKMFLTKNRDLAQSYVYSEGGINVMKRKGNQNEFGSVNLAGRNGPEIFVGLKDMADEAISIATDLLNGERVIPGEYEVITSPEVSGLIAHEAFGHGVEMDMFVKNRALGKDYIGKRVGSEHVTMHEGALSAVDVASYAFDDEGVLASDVVEIDKGILKSGICDALSAKRLNFKATGNGKRENYAHKAYTRMTNTLFEGGNNTLDEMIASIEYGYLLKGMRNGMEDPKHWGIQCVVDRGYEIKDGKLTGKIVCPLVLTGYVPDVLGNVTMATKEAYTFGTGGCGKGHKEWVKVSDGGPYLKTKVRLG